jgi:hypothetical protein
VIVRCDDGNGNIAEEFVAAALSSIAEGSEADYAIGKPKTVASRLPGAARPAFMASPPSADDAAPGPDSFSDIQRGPIRFSQPKALI